MADKSSMPVGRRQKARIAQRKRRRLIAASVIILLCLLVVFLVWMSRQQGSRTEGEEDMITSSVTENNEGLVIPELLPEDTDQPEETIPVETEPVAETAPPQETVLVQETQPAQENETPAPAQTGAAGTGGTGTTNTGTNKGSTGTTNTGTNKGSTGTTNTNQKPAETVTLKSGTLSCSVTTATQGGQAKLTWKAVDSKGNDITSKCSISYSASGCTVQGNTVTFPNVGKVSVTGTITYNGKSVTTNTISVEVAVPVPSPKPESVLTSVRLSCPVSTVKRGETAQLTVTALDADGKDITGDCSITYTVAGCTVSGNTVTFDTLGTAALTAAVTYKDVTLNTETAAVTVIGPLSTVTLTCTPDNGKTAASVGDTATLTVQTVDAGGNPLTGCTVTYTATAAAVEGNKVTFNQGGKVTITATAVLDDVTVTSNTVTVYVDFRVVLTKAGNLTVPMGQHVTNGRYGWYVCLPTLAAKVVEKDANGKEIVNDGLVTYRYDPLGMSVSVASADREETKATAEELYNARIAALTADQAQILTSTKPTEAGYYQITWQKEETVTTERCYVGAASQSTLSAAYPAEKRAGAEQLLSIIASTFETGNLNATHPEK